MRQRTSIIQLCLGGLKLRTVARLRGATFQLIVKLYRYHVSTAMRSGVIGTLPWRRSTVEEIAEAERINSSYVGRVLRLSLLAPDIVEMIINGRQPTSLQLDQLLRPFPVEWERQKREFGGDAATSVRRWQQSG